MRNKIKNVGFIGAIDFGATTSHLEMIINQPAEKVVVMMIHEGGRSIGRTAAIELMKKAMEEMKVVIGSPTQEKIQSEFNHLLGFDILPMRFAPLPTFTDLTPLTNKKGKPLDEPKSKYINRPIKNYRR